MTLMNSTPSIKVTDDGPEVDVSTASLPLEHAVNTHEQMGDTEHPELVRKRAINELTGASIHLPLQVVP